MRRAVHLNLAAILIALVQFLYPSSGHAQEMSSDLGLQTFDGNWWAKANLDERVGFLYALDDCLTYDAVPHLRFDDTWTNYEKRITSYYASPSANTTASVQQVFERFAKKPIAAKRTKQGERYGDEFWRAHNVHARRGFLEGYISCRTRYKNSVKWSKPVSYYLEKLDDIYNVDDRHGENALENVDSVASALEKLQDLR
jgi:hypothetical protein